MIKILSSPFPSSGYFLVIYKHTIYLLDLDVTELPEGIDAAFLAALPKDMQQEVIDEQNNLKNTRKRTATQSIADIAPDIDPEFLAALPTNIQEEVSIYVYKEIIFQNDLLITKYHLNKGLKSYEINEKKPLKIYIFKFFFKNVILRF